MNMSVFEFAALCTPFGWQYGMAFIDFNAAVLSMRNTLAAYKALVPVWAETPTQKRTLPGGDRYPEEIGSPADEGEDAAHVRAS
jgi:hypothetical protein